MVKTVKTNFILKSIVRKKPKKTAVVLHTTLKKTKSIFSKSWNTK